MPQTWDTLQSVSPTIILVCSFPPFPQFPFPPIPPPTRNCVCTVDLRCTPNLEHIATSARNAEYNPQRFAAVIMRLREPKVRE